MPADPPDPIGGLAPDDVPATVQQMMVIGFKVMLVFEDPNNPGEWIVAPNPDLPGIE